MMEGPGHVYTIRGANAVSKHGKADGDDERRDAKEKL